jgi:hypothetical protein
LGDRIDRGGRLLRPGPAGVGDPIGQGVYQDAHLDARLYHAVCFRRWVGVDEQRGEGRRDFATRVWTFVDNRCQCSARNVFIL